MSKKFSLLLVALLLILPLTMAACGGDDDKDDKKDDAKSADLTQTFESASGVTVKYPEGWVAKDGSSGLQIANSQASMDAMDDTSLESVPEGVFAVLIMAAPLEMMMLEADIKMTDAIGVFSGEMASEEGTTVSDPKEVKVGGKDGARVDLSSDKDNSEGFMLVYKADDDTLVIAAAVAHKGEMSTNEATAMQIIESITYAAPAADAG